MTIGEALKSLRLNAGLTQTEMAAGVVTESFYSKIERGVHSIDANTLIKILTVHHFDVVEFFSRIANQKNSNQNFELIAKINLAQNKKDLQMLKQIKADIKKQNGGVTPPILLTRLELAQAWIKHSNQDISQKTKRQLSRILKNENWDRISYHYLSQAVILMDIDQASQLVNLAFRAFKKHPAYDTFTLQFVALIAVNFLNCCYHKNGEKYAQPAIDFLRSLPTDFTLGLANILATYYEALFNHDQLISQECISILKKSNYLSVIADTLA